MVEKDTKQKSKFNIKSLFGTLFKLFLLGIGIADIANILPPSLDILDKGLAAIILLVYWMQLKPIKFMFGSDKKWLDKVTLTTFYILVIDMFVQLIRIIEHNIEPVAKVFVGFNFATISNVFRSAFLYLWDPANGTTISLFSAIVGFSLMIGIAFYTTFKVKFGEKSVVNSILSIFQKKGKDNKSLEKIYSNKLSAFTPLKFIISLVVLFLISQYFFGLITQWFIVSLDKSLLILAILFAVKDISKTKSKALNKIGNFDEWLLGKITDIFTNPKKFYLGFGILLVFHYLSDLATFFIPFFFRGMTIDPFYLSLMGHESPAAITTLFQGEVLTTLFQKIAASVTYILSGAGAVLLIVIPILFIFFIINKVDFSKLVDKKAYIIPLIIFFLSIVAFTLGPWVYQQSIAGSGIQGVDFLTKSISTSAIPMTTIVIIIGALLLFSFFAFNKKVSRYLTMGIYLGSLIYLGKYIWNYFLSSWSYHVGTIMYFNQSGKFFLAFMFAFLLLLEIFFYIGGFLILAYQSSRYLINQIIRPLLTNKAIYLWTIILLLLPMYLLYPLNIATSYAHFMSIITGASIVILTLFIFSFAMYKELTGTEYRDDYILGVNVAIIAYQILLILTVFLSRIGLSEGISNFIQPIIIFILTLFALKFFDLKILFNRKYFNRKFFVVSIAASIMFGIFFYLFNEPIVPLFAKGILILIVYTLLVGIAEEILFRFVIFRLAEKAFKYKVALIIQALVFAIIHMTSIQYIYSHYLTEGSLLFGGAIPLTLIYFFGLFVFGIVAGKLVGPAQSRKKFTGNIIYAIILHWLTNLIRVIL